MPSLNKTDRTELPGLGIGRRAAVGPVVRMAPPLPEPSTAPSTEGADAETARVRAALRDVAISLRSRGAAVGGAAADVLEAQALMAEDPALDAEIDAGIARGRTAARAAYDAFGTFRAALAAAGPYLAARVVDLDDVRQRVVAGCLGVPVPGVPDPGHPYVLVARDLAPADTATLDLDTVLALVTAEGGPTSHTAVLARSRGIPAVVGCGGATDIDDGTTVLVDPASSRVVVRPTPGELPRVTTVGASDHGPGRTADGRHIALLANVAGPADVRAAVAAGAEGVGLYRTELLFLDATAAPDADTQIAAYRGVFAGFPGGRVVVRVLDAGADKPLKFMPQEPEPNPALGVRGIRALRRQPAILDTQLSSIATAAAAETADVWVMAPMVADADEAAWFVAECAKYGLNSSGVMIEVPSAAMLADQILDVAGFVSVGTNDLAQYGLAVDRQAGGLGALQDPWHPGLLRLIEVIGRAGRSSGRPVGVCGEAAADPLLARVLVGLGVTSLSMAPPAIADVRASLADVTLDDCRAVAARAVATRNPAAARSAATG